jgi:hypothetical protein
VYVSVYRPTGMNSTPNGTSHRERGNKRQGLGKDGSPKKIDQSSCELTVVEINDNASVEKDRSCKIINKSGITVPP